MSKKILVSFRPFLAMLMVLLTLPTTFQTEAQEIVPDLEVIGSSNVTRLELIKSWQPNDEILSPYLNITPSTASNIFLLENRHNSSIGTINADTSAFGITYRFETDRFITRTVISTDGRTAAVNGLSKIDVWNTENGELRFSIEGNEDSEINEIAFASNNELFAYSYGNNGEQTAVDGVYVIDMNTGDQIQFLPHPKSLIFMFSPDSQTLVSGSFDGSVKLWNLQDGSFLQLRPADENGITQLEYVDDETLAIAFSGERIGGLEFWDTIQNQERTTKRRPELSYYIKNGIGQTRLDDLISVQLWRLGDDKNLALLKGLNIEDVNSEDNLVITSAENGVQFHRLDTGEIIHILDDATLSYAHARLSFDKRYLVVCNTSGQVQLWGVPAL